MQDRQRTLTTPQTMWARRVAQERGALTHQSDVGERARLLRELAEDSLRDAYRLAGAILRDPAEAEDAVHDAFVAGWQKWPTLRDVDKFDAWFRRIVVNVCRERLRTPLMRALPIRWSVSSSPVAYRRCLDHRLPSRSARQESCVDPRVPRSSG